jgi:hypothetical protein
METTPFDLTPEQKGLLAALSRQTGKPIPALLAEALAVLQAQERSGPERGRRDVQEPAPPVMASPEAPKPIWEIFAEASQTIPEEELAHLPPDLAAQVDHYVYGVPKR